MVQCRWKCDSVGGGIVWEVGLCGWWDCVVEWCGEVPVLKPQVQSEGGWGVTAVHSNLISWCGDVVTMDRLITYNSRNDCK